MQTSPRLLYCCEGQVLTSAKLAVLVKSEGGGVMGCRVWVEAETLPLMQTLQHFDICAVTNIADLH